MSMYWGSMEGSGLTPRQMHEQVGLLEIGRGELYLASCANILRNAYGFVQSAEANRPLDARGRPLPLYTYPAIEYLDQFDLSQKSVFEFGAGASTLYWMERARRVVSVESDRVWCQSLRPLLKPHVELRLEEGDEFPFCIEEYAERFDLIVVDGAGYRYDCATAALGKRAEGGMIVLDNADWHPQTAAVLRKAGLLQVDMSGFKPTEHHCSTTSLFLDRQFAWETIEPRQPSFAMGARRAHSSAWDRPYARRKDGQGTTLGGP